MSHWLSVVMPIHDGAKHLGKALESVVAEGADGLELRLYNSYDDGGAARRVAEHYADRLDIVWQDRFDLKPWTAKTNLGIAEARAPHIAMLHQDDFWLPGHLVAIRKSIGENPNAAMSIGPSRFASDDGSLLSKWSLPFPAGEHAVDALVDTLLVQNTVAIPSPVIRRDAWQECGGLDEELWYTADWDLYLKLAKAGAVIVRPEATTAFRVHGNSLTVTGSRDLDAFRAQMETVLTRHAVAPSARARTSIKVNCALASAAAGGMSELPSAAWALLKLGPWGLARYLAQASLIDRIRPRLRLKFAGGF